VMSSSRGREQATLDRENVFKHEKR